MVDRLQIKPVYGYGWEENGTRIEVPEPFAVDVETGVIGDVPHPLVGTVVGSHRFAGKMARLDRRTSGPPPYYNVLIYEKSSPSDAHDTQGEFVVPTATGFAELA